MRGNSPDYKFLGKIFMITLIFS